MPVSKISSPALGPHRTNYCSRYRACTTPVQGGISYSNPPATIRRVACLRGCSVQRDRGPRRLEGVRRFVLESAQRSLELARFTQKGCLAPQKSCIETRGTRLTGGPGRGPVKAFALFGLCCSVLFSSCCCFLVCDLCLLAARHRGGARPPPFWPRCCSPHTRAWPSWHLPEPVAAARPSLVLVLTRLMFCWIAGGGGGGGGGGLDCPWPARRQPRALDGTTRAAASSRHSGSGDRGKAAGGWAGGWAGG